MRGHCHTALLHFWCEQFLMNFLVPTFIAMLKQQTAAGKARPCLTSLTSTHHRDMCKQNRQFSNIYATVYHTEQQRAPLIRFACTLY